MNFIQYLGFIPKLGAYCSHQLSRLSFRQKNKWVFGCHFGFADNPKYLFLDVCINHPEIHAIWISHKYRDLKRIQGFGGKAYYWLDVRGVFHALTSKVWISGRTVIDINRFISGGAFFVNLHHGVGIKKCYWQCAEKCASIYGVSKEGLAKSFLLKVLLFPYWFRVADLCLATSQSQKDEFIKPQYRLSDSQCLCANTPRNHLLSQSKEQIKSLAMKYENEETLYFINKMEKYKKVYIYMPTWRDNGKDFIEEAHFDFRQLNSVLKQNDYLLIMKLHPFTKIDMGNMNSYENICLFPSGIDLFMILPFTDCLVTDYSSAYSDAVYMNKEIILYSFDYEDYIGKCHDLGNYDQYYRGVKVYTFQELLYTISEHKDCHLSISDREYLMNYYWSYTNNGINIVSEIKKRIGWEETI